MSRAAMPTMLTLLVLLVRAPLAAAEPADSTRVDGRLGGAVWRGRALGEELAGSACWLRGPEGSLRLEVVRGADAGPLPAVPAWDRLLRREGDGLVVLVVAGRAVAGRWGAALESLDAVAQLRLATLIALLETPGGAPPLLPSGVTRAERPRMRGAGNGAPGPDGFDLVLPESLPLRQALELRGRGHGGTGETWRVRPAPPGATAEAGALAIASSRWSGSLELRAVAGPRIRFSPDDAFVPVWPLAELLEFPAGSLPARDGEPVSGGPR